MLLGQCVMYILDVSRDSSDRWQRWWRTNIWFGFAHMCGFTGASGKCGNVINVSSVIQHTFTLGHGGSDKQTENRSFCK